MDYHNSYNAYYQRAFTISKQMVLAKMKKAKAKKRPFLTVHNKITQEIYEYYKVKFSNRLITDCSEAYNIFQKKHEYYDGTEQEVVSWILEDEVRFSFKKDNSNLKYRAFIIDLAVEACLKDINRHFSSYKDYYELIYEFDKYEYFYFKDFNGISFNSSEEFKELMELKYPHKEIERQKALTKGEEVVVISTDQESSRKDRNNNVESDASLELFSNFTDDEKFLLINLLYNDKQLEIGIVEYMKIIRIVGSYNDVSIFNDSPKNSTPYSKVNKGLDYYTSVDNKKKLLKSTKNKLQALKLKALKPILEMMLLNCK